MGLLGRALIHVRKMVGSRVCMSGRWVLVLVCSIMCVCIMWIVLYIRSKFRYFCAMLVYGTANPPGEEESTYDGMLLTGYEINRMVLDRDLVGLPVLLEHAGNSVGTIVAAWQHRGQLDLILSIDEKSPNLSSVLASSFVSGNVCKDLSLGYTVAVHQSAEGTLSTSTKKVSEVSLVKRGAREHCHIHGFFGS